MDTVETLELRAELQLANSLLHLQSNVDFKRVMIDGIAKRKSELIETLTNPDMRAAAQEELLAFSYIDKYLSTIKLTGDSARDALATDQ